MSGALPRTAGMPDENGPSACLQDRRLMETRKYKSPAHGNIMCGIFLRLAAGISQLVK